MIVFQEHNLKDHKILCDNKQSPAAEEAVDDSELEIIFEGSIDCDQLGCDEIDQEGDVQCDSEQEDESDSESDASEVEYDLSSDDDDSADAFATAQPPFWFSYEDPDQVAEIINIYTATLRLDQEQKACVRAPPPFVGRVKRVQVENSLFTTLDQVSVYTRDLRPLGISLPFRCDVWFLTTWDVDEGVPLRFFEVTKKELIEFWQARACGEYSYLYCRPVYNSKCQWKCEASSYDSPIVYTAANFSLVYAFNLYLPASCGGIRQCNDSL
jgi:hypothetical protein